MDAAAWLARFAERDEAWRSAMVERHREIGERIRAELAPKVRIVPVPIVLERAEIDAGSDDLVLSTARRVAVAALAAGWAVRAVRAVAAVPGKGIVESWSVKAARHGDERLVAVWAGVGRPGFDCAFYLGPGATALERLGAAKARGRRTVLDAINGVRLSS